MHQFPQYQGPHMMAQADMPRQYPGFPPPQCQSPSPNGFSLPPGPRPRPVGGDSSPPGFTPDSLPSHIGEEPSSQTHSKDQEQQPQLVIGSWNEECDKEAVSAPHTVAPPVLQNLSQPPPRHVSADQEWGGTFHVPRGGGQQWGAPEFEHFSFTSMTAWLRYRSEVQVSTAQPHRRILLSTIRIFLRW